MRDRRTSIAAVALTAVVALAVVAFVLLGLELAGRGGGGGSAAGAIELEGGVPVGVEHTAAGALAAADNYVAASSQTLEQDPGAFGALVARVYAAANRAQTLAQAQRLRLRDPVAMANYG